jgi:hypothetical protein
VTGPNADAPLDKNSEERIQLATVRQNVRLDVTAGFLLSTKAALYRLL